MILTFIRFRILFSTNITNFSTKNNTILQINLSQGLTGSRHSGPTIVPSFRFNKADDQMVEVTPTSSFDEMDESHTDNGSVQDSTFGKSEVKGEDEQFYHDLINTGSSSLMNFESIDEYYGAGENLDEYYGVVGKFLLKRMLIVIIRIFQVMASN